MDVTVKEHIANLEARIQALAAELMEERDRSKRNLMESEIRAAELAISHYRAALLLESVFNRGRS